ncbi:MAG: tetratricopeptide repeat protein, partial [Polyangiales bacterium]
LSNAVDERPDDLALWETLRNAARQAGQWPLVAQSCERLAQFVQGSLKADLLEEAGVVRMDHLEQDQQAEDLFRCALEEDPSRDVAFRRLHDLLAAQEDADALQALVSDRLALGGPKGRLDLLYERARLLRGFSDRPGALEALEELFESEPEHPGALALAAEVHVSLERWAEAVDCLRRLSKANIPDAQRRVAHLGAADFLEAHLMAKHEALVELRAVEALGLADAQVWTRIGAIEASFDKRGAAADAYARALQAEPTNAVAISGLVELLDGEARRAALGAYENAIWEQIDAGKLDPGLLEGLRNTARWLGHDARADAVLAVQRALALVASDGDERAANLGLVRIDGIWDRESDPLLRKVMVRVGPTLPKARLRAKRAAPDDPLCADLEHISSRFGARAGSIELSEELATLVARSGRDGAIDWVAPAHARAGLSAKGRFLAGRLAWAVAHGAADVLDASPPAVAGLLAAIFRVARCEIAPGEPALPGAEVKLRRSVRKDVREIVRGATFDPGSLLRFARALQRSADRAGLLASGDIAAALATLLNDRVTVKGLRSSSRGLDLLRFWLANDLWLRGNDG